MALPKIVADLETSLTAKIAVGGTTGTIASNVDDDGVTLTDGTYYFTLDGNNSAKEHIRCTKTGTSLSDIYSYSRQGVATEGCAREHRVGAKVIMTDYATYKNYFEAAVISGPGTSTNGNIVTWTGTAGAVLGTGLALDTDLSSVSASDDSVPSAKATKTALDLKAPLASPAFTTAATIDGVAVPTISSTNTLTNKRITQRIQKVVDAATLTPNADNDDLADMTSLDQALTIANPSGTPTDGQKLIIRIKDAGTARALTWGDKYIVVGTTLPTTTVIGKAHYIGCIYNSNSATWNVVAVVQQV